MAVLRRGYMLSGSVLCLSVGHRKQGCEPLELLGCVLNENVTVIKGAPFAAQELVRDGLEMSSGGTL